MSQLPIIDISPAIVGTDVSGVAEAVAAACTNAGFFLAKGHGIARRTFDDVYEHAAELWALPAAEKNKLRSPHGHPFRGLISFDDPAGVPLQEKWYINRFDGPLHAQAHAAPLEFTSHFAPNVWPYQLPDLVIATIGCFEATHQLARRLLALFAAAIGVTEEVLEAHRDDDGSYFSLNGYPGRSRLQPGSVAMPEHTDSGTLTILHQRGNYAGLQVRRKDGGWMTIPVVEDTVLVFVGDLMARWTNNRWPAAVHRAVLGDPGSTRTSVTLFHTPRVNAVIRPLANCIGSEGSLFEPITVFEFDRQILDASSKDV